MMDFHSLPERAYVRLKQDSSLVCILTRNGPRASRTYQARVIVGSQRGEEITISPCQIAEVLSAPSKRQEFRKMVEDGIGLAEAAKAVTSDPILARKYSTLGDIQRRVIETTQSMKERQITFDMSAARSVFADIIAEQEARGFRFDGRVQDELHFTLENPLPGTVTRRVSHIPGWSLDQITIQKEANMAEEPKVKMLYGETRPVYYVWGQGQGQPTSPHPSRFRAHKEAQRLARKNPGVKFHVLKLKETIEGTVTPKLQIGNKVQVLPGYDREGQTGQIVNILSLVEGDVRVAFDDGNCANYERGCLDLIDYSERRATPPLSVAAPEPAFSGAAN